VFTGLPEFTNQSPLTVTGTTEGGARVDLFVNDAATALTTTTTSAGTFTLAVPLALNAANALEVFATAKRGNGLTSAPVEATVTHDSIAPGLAFQAPPALAHVRQLVPIQAEASDGGSLVAQLTLSAGVQPLTATLVPTPPAGTVTASATWDTTQVGDGDGPSREHDDPHPPGHCRQHPARHHHHGRPRGRHGDHGERHLRLHGQR
jgi:hypothetical protein